MKIEALKQEDIDEIVKLKASLFNYHLKIDKFYKPRKGFREMYKNHMETALHSETHKIFVAKENQKILGFIEGSITQISNFFEKNVLGCVSEIFVKEEHRQKGVAKKLLENLLKWFKSKRIKTIEVVVDSRNKKAIKAWESLGFVEYQKKLKLVV